MLSFNRVFGAGAPLRQRPIWTGAERLLPGVVVSQIRPFKMRSKVAPAAGIDRIAYSGSIYAVVSSSSLYTGGSLLALSGRVSPTVNILSMQSLGGEIFLMGNPSGQSYMTVHRSADGVTWTGIGGSWDSGNALHVANGKLYLVGTYNRGLQEYNPATGAFVNRALPENSIRDWNGIYHNGAVFLVCCAPGSSYTAGSALVSEDGVTFTSASAAFSAAMRLMPIGASYIYVLGSKFIAVGANSQSNHIATMESTNGRDWTATGSCQVAGTGRTIGKLSQRGIVIDGVLYVGAVLLDNGKYIPTLLSTTDGIAWRAHADTDPLNSDPANIEIFRKPGSNGLILCCTNFETDVDNGLELYYEL